MPGEDRRKRRADRSVNGVTLPATLLKQLDELAASLKIEPLGARFNVAVEKFMKPVGV